MGRNIAGKGNMLLAVSFLIFWIAGFEHLFQRSHTFFRLVCDIPALKLNDAHLLLKGQRLPSLKSEKGSHVHCCQLKLTYSLKELLPFINTID